MGRRLCNVLCVYYVNCYYVLWQTVPLRNGLIKLSCIFELPVPGQRLARKDETTKVGPGTYERNGFIYSSLAGPVQKETLTDGTVCFTFIFICLHNNI